MNGVCPICGYSETISSRDDIYCSRCGYVFREAVNYDYQKLSNHVLRPQTPNTKMIHRYISSIVEALDLPYSVYQDAMSYILTYNLRPISPRIGAIALSILAVYNVLRRRGAPYTISNIINLLREKGMVNVEKKHIYRAIKKHFLMSKVKAEPGPKIYEYIDFTLNRLGERGISIENPLIIRYVADHIAKDMKRYISMSPKLIAAIAIYTYFKMMGRRDMEITLIDELADILEVSRYTLNKWIRRVNESNLNLIHRAGNG